MNEENAEEEKVNDVNDVEIDVPDGKDEQLGEDEERVEKKKKRKKDKKEKKGKKGKKGGDDENLIFGMDKQKAYMYAGGLFIGLVVLIIVLWQVLKPRLPDTVTICEFQFCQLLGKQLGPECADEMERIAINGTGVLVANSALKFSNPNLVSLTAGTWKVQLDWAANDKGKAVTMLYCSGKNSDVAANSDLRVPFSCTLDAKETAFPAMIEAYWQNAVLGIDTVVDASITVGGVYSTDVHWEHQTTLNRGESGGTEETLIYGPDGVLDGWDGELEQRFAGTWKGGGEPSPIKVQMGDKSGNCPSGLDVAPQGKSVSAYICGVWLQGEWVEAVQNCTNNAMEKIGDKIRELGNSAADLLDGGLEGLAGGLSDGLGDGLGDDLKAILNETKKDENCLRALEYTKVGVSFVVDNPMGLAVTFDDIALEGFLNPIKKPGVKPFGTGNIYQNKSVRVAPYTNTSLLAEIEVRFDDGFDNATFDDRAVNAMKLAGSFAAAAATRNFSIGIDGFMSVQLLGMKVDIDLPRIINKIELSPTNSSNATNATPPPPPAPLDGSGKKDEEGGFGKLLSQVGKGLDSVNNMLREVDEWLQAECHCLFGDCIGNVTALKKVYPGGASALLNADRKDGALCLFDSQCISGFCSSLYKCGDKSDNRTTGDKLKDGAKNAGNAANDAACGKCFEDNCKQKFCKPPPPPVPLDSAPFPPPPPPKVVETGTKQEGENCVVGRNQCAEGLTCAKLRLKCKKKDE